MNYTEAASTCEGHRGHLAPIVSEARTNFLSFLIQQQVFDINKTPVISPSTVNENGGGAPLSISIKHAFVGLQEVGRKGNFVDSLGIPIQCYRYRAWAPKFPR